MRFSLATIVFSAILSAGALTLERRQQTFPTCADSCVADPPNLFGCSPSDNHCLCTNQQYVDATTQCIVGACDADDAASAEALSRELCAQVGVTLTSTPAAATPTGSSTSGSSTSAPSGSSTPAPAPSGGSSSSGSSSAPAPSNSNTSGAVTNGANVLVGAAALVLAAINL